MRGSHISVYIGTLDYGSHFDIRDSQFLSNTAYMTGTTGGDGGALYLDDTGDGALLRIVSSTFRGNEAQDSYAGIYANLDVSRLELKWSRIEANVAMTDSGALAIETNNEADYYLHYNEILDNQAASYGGVYVEDPDGLSYGVSLNNLIAGNDSGGFYLAKTSNPPSDTLFMSLNDTVADNAGYGFYFTSVLPFTPTLTNDIIWGNGSVAEDGIITGGNAEVAVSYTDAQDGVFPGTGNISTDPLFMDDSSPTAADNNYRLQGISPAVDTGTNDPAAEQDLDMIPRPVDGDDDSVAIVDMGAYEYRTTGVEVDALVPSGTLSGDPGTTVTHTVVVTNTGSAVDTFTLALSGNSWTSTLMSTTVTLDPDESTTVDVAVEIPSDASEGDSDSVMVSATSQSDPSTVDAATLTTVANLVPDVAISPDNSDTAQEGTTITYTHTVDNLSNGTATFDLSVSSSEGWTVDLTLPRMNRVGFSLQRGLPDETGLMPSPRAICGSECPAEPYSITSTRASLVIARLSRSTGFTWRETRRHNRQPIRLFMC